MTTPARRASRGLPPLLAALLAACAVPAPRPAPPRGDEPIVAPPSVVSAPGALPAVPDAKPSRPTADGWSQLREQFRMPGCDSDPAVMHWAYRFTANPKRFEWRLEQSLPRLRYIQGVARQHDVAGEFVLLPWVESRYLPVVARGHRPGGMWQIMPVTAASLGLKVTRHFDGRMDMAAATDAVMSLLARYQEEFGDWRLTDYAYNAGEFAVKRLLDRHGKPPAEPTIPDLPVRQVTREHLIKLLAVACVIREPGRFGVSLPTLPADEHLVAVPVPHPMSMARAAAHAGLPVDVLKSYNAAFLDNRIDPSRASSLMLPGNRVEQFAQAVRDAERSGAIDLPPTIVVRPGDTLWVIARRHGVSVAELKRWNDLRTSTLRPGQTLRLTAPD